MIWRVLLTAVYAGAFGALVALENFIPGISDTPLLAVWLVAPVIGFLVGRWWVLFAVIGALAGRVIGWDSGENDGNPALWPPYVLTTIVFLGLPLLLGVVLSEAWQGRHRRAAQPSSVEGRRERSSITEEVDRLAADDADRSEMQVVREQMAELAPESRD